MCDHAQCSFLCFILFFETGFLCVTLAVLELALETSLASVSSAGIEGVCRFLRTQPQPVLAQ